MRNKKAGLALGLLELLALLQAWRIWMLPFSQSSVDSFSHLMQIITESISVMLILLPLAGMFIIFRQKRWGFLLMAGFPLLCIIFGITAFPGISFFYGNDAKLNSLFIAFANALVCAVAFWLFVSGRPEYVKK